MEKQHDIQQNIQKKIDAEKKETQKAEARLAEKQSEVDGLKEKNESLRKSKGNALQINLQKQMLEALREDNQRLKQLLKGKRA